MLVGWEFISTFAAACERNSLCGGLFACALRIENNN